VYWCGIRCDHHDDCFSALFSKLQTFDLGHDRWLNHGFRNRMFNGDWCYEGLSYFAMSLFARWTVTKSRRCAVCQTAGSGDIAKTTAKQLSVHEAMSEMPEQSDMASRQLALKRWARQAAATAVVTCRGPGVKREDMDDGSPRSRAVSLQITWRMAPKPSSPLWTR
jgi:hypothetical protein